MASPRPCFGLAIAREVIRVSVPLMFGMVGNLIMMLVDRICLARYSADTLRASGPAVFTAMTMIIFVTSTVGITRSYVAQAHGRRDHRGALEEGATGTVLAALLAVLLLAAAPLISRIPELSGQPPEIVALESDFLGWSTCFGAVMAINMALSSYFNGVGRTRLPMTVGLIGQAVGVVMTIGLVFGRFGLPELGMRGAAFGTLCAVSAMFVGYVVSLPKGLLAGFRRLAGQGAGGMAGVLWLRLRRGAPAGGSLGLDELGQTAFVWLAGVLGPVALAANNVALSLNYVAIIPLIGLGIGCSILCGNALGDDRHASVPHIIRVTLVISGLYVAAISVLQIAAPALLLSPFGLDQDRPETVITAVATSRVLWTYAVAFMFSMVGSSVLECFGLARFAFVTRVAVMWALSIPLICWIALANRGNPDLLPVLWVIFSLFEGVLAVPCFWRIRRAVMSRENQLVASAELPRTV